MQYLLLLIGLIACNNHPRQTKPPAIAASVTTAANPYATIAAIPLPPGYTRTAAAANSFVAWLRQLALKKNKTVYLFNGLPKHNQAAQFAVIDITVGNKDLQQCADAIMRLRAEWLYSQQQLTAIDFTDNNKTHYRLPATASRAVFDQYLEKVFSYCGTASLEKQLLAVNNFSEITPGDVLIKGGSPGHAMLVIDMAVNAAGKKIYLLAQGYMPAQDIHVVINPDNSNLSPWYQANEQPVIYTPEWVFNQTNLKKWPE